ncbi:MAG: heparinase II/III family protein [Allosphingosinicella sp.]|uniref:heparinase II/III domain-containing protein n=1 Tax=Allosphingosinicella sp. TaxID=2823234 RepID=UPI00393B701B
MGLIGRLGRAWRFGRHMPPRKLAHRWALEARRRIALRRPPRLDSPGPERLRPSPAPPLPLFPPRGPKAERLGQGWRFTFVGRTVEMAGGIDWSAPGPGPEHQLWRMNLHYMEYLEALDAETAAELIGRWIADNPPYRPGYWRDSWNSYALSLRVVVWMQQLARHGGRLATADVLDSLAAQLLFLERNLERDLGGNHLMKNIKALAWASVFFEGPVATRWRALGLRLLDHELRHQILPDGMHDERSASYHAQVLADLVEIRHALGRDPLSGRLDGAIRAMAQAAADLAHPDGGPVLFNDSGLTMAYSPAQCLDAAARVLGEAPPAPSPVFAYPAAGYFGLRAGAVYLTADMGRIGPDDLPAHGHGDIGSFELSVAGERLIVDQGVFEYIEGERRTRARAAASHNTLALDGADQAEFFGAFRCGRRPNVTVRRWETRDGGFLLEGSHDGYAYLPGRPIAVRRIEADAAAIRVHDWIEGRTDRAASAGLLLHPDATAEREDGAILIRRGGAAARLRHSGEAWIEPAVHWPDMGAERPTLRIRLPLADPVAGGDFTIEII